MVSAAEEARSYMHGMLSLKKVLTGLGPLESWVGESLSSFPSLLCLNPGQSYDSKKGPLITKRYAKDIPEGM